jgi:Flp pilus assembly protein TadG
MEYVRLRGCPSMKMRRAERGAAVIELAVVLPLFLLVLFAIVEWGVMFYDQAVLSNASYVAARAAAVSGSTYTTASDVQTLAVATCQQQLISLGAAAVPTAVATGVGSGTGNQVSVTVSYAYSGLGLGKLLRTFAGTEALSSTTVMLNE